MLALVIVAFLVPMVTSAGCSLWVMGRASSWGLIDQPSLRKDHGRAVPLGGGIGIYLGVGLMLVLVLVIAHLVRAFPTIGEALPELVRVHAAGVVNVSSLLALLLAAGLIQTGLGLWDDVYGIDYRVRLGVEVLLVLGLVSQGVELAFLPGWRMLTIPLTVLWVVGLTNAFNFLDNMDGLSAGVGLIVSIMLAIIAWLVGDLFLLGCYAILAGSLIGFLWFNWSPARIFMGDAGSNFLGFWIGTLTVISTFKTEQYSAVTLLAPLCILAVPIYDVATVSVIRLAQGRSPFHPDRQHFSHRLVGLGFSRQAAVSIIHLVTLVTGLSGLVLYFVDPRAVWLIIAQWVSLLVLLAILDVGGWRRNAHPMPHQERSP
jgi:UDP-GlcNAc:undecaprenyl-phosphate/decaprenyl-phosphate GlcNAc-1-phosphate transferase